MIPVDIVENGLGIPVIPVVDDDPVVAQAPAAVVATNGIGIPIVLGEKNGIPMIIEGLPE